MVPALVFSLAAIAGLVATWLSLRATKRIRNRHHVRADLLADGVEATGTVVAVHDSPDGRRMATVPDINYLTMTGSEITAAPIDPWPLPFEEGQSIEVLYDPADPIRMTLARPTPGTPVWFASAVTAVLALLTIGVIFFAVRLWAVSGGHSFDLPGVDVPGVVLPSNRGG